MLTGYISNEGKLADNTTLIFLGDYVSRGSYGIEVLYTVLNLKIMNPDNVFFDKGNHKEINLHAR